MERRDAGAGRLKLGLVADQRNWAFDHTARNIARHLSDDCDVELLYLQDYEGYAQLHRHLFGEERGYDVLHFFWRESLAALFDPVAMSAAVQGLQPGRKNGFCAMWHGPPRRPPFMITCFWGQDEKETAHTTEPGPGRCLHRQSRHDWQKFIKPSGRFLPPAFMLPDAVDLDAIQAR
jgi:hypothetical protein